MSVRTVLVGVLALVFGLSAAMGIQLAMRTPKETPTDNVPIVVAATDIQRVTTLTPDLLRIQEIPRELVPPDAITQVEDALERGTLTFLARGETVLNSKISAKGVRGMAVAIPSGMRAVTIRTPDVATPVGGFALPGSKVDVVLTVRSMGVNDSSGGGVTTTLLQNVEVLAVDQRVETPADQKMDPNQLRSVTLLVTPEQAAKLQLGQTLGVLHLSLRNPLDGSVTTTAVASLKDFHLPKPRPADVPPPRVEPKAEPAPAVKPPPPPPPPPPAIRSVRGSESSWARIQ